MSAENHRHNSDEWQDAAYRALETLRATLALAPEVRDDAYAQLLLPAEVLATNAISVAVIQADGRVLFANPGACQLLGLRFGTDPARPPSGSQEPADAEPLPAEILAFRWVATTGVPLFEVRSEILCAEGRRRILSVNAVPVAGDDQRPPRVALAMTDLTDQYAYYEQALRDSQERLKLATEAAGLGVWEYDLVAGRYHWDERMLEIYGLTEDQAPVTYEDWLERVLTEYYTRVSHIDSDQPQLGERREVEFRIRRPDGTVRHIRAVWQCIEDQEGRPTRLVGTNEDVTEQRELQHELEYRAAHDPLTDLFNRAKIQQLLRTAQASFQRHGTPFALLLFDVDHFKRVNDRYGHGAGDAVLWQMARRVESVLRDTDHLGRWGGEEFLILASHTDEAGAHALAERIRNRVKQEAFEGIGTITVSFGVAAIEPGLTLEQLEQRADLAMYAAKHAGRDQSMRFSEVDPANADSDPASGIHSSGPGRPT